MRLIDADELWEKMYRYTDNEGAKMPYGDDDSLIHKDSACFLIENAPTIKPEPQWIPVAERLPEDEYVLISKKPTKISGDKWSVAIAIRIADPRSRKVQWRDSGFGVIQDDKVLAWMPLPKPWEGVKE